MRLREDVERCSQRTGMKHVRYEPAVVYTLLRCEHHVGGAGPLSESWAVTTHVGTLQRELIVVEY